MSDAERRQKERNALRSGSIDDILAAMRIDIRAGCIPEAVDKARRALFLDSSRQEARDVIKKTDPYAWTGLLIGNSINKIQVIEPGGEPTDFILTPYLPIQNNQWYPLSAVHINNKLYIILDRQEDGPFDLEKQYQHYLTITPKGITCDPFSISPSERQSNRLGHDTALFSYRGKPAFARLSAEEQWFDVYNLLTGKRLARTNGAPLSWTKKRLITWLDTENEEFQLLTYDGKKQTSAQTIHDKENPTYVENQTIYLTGPLNTVRAHTSDTPQRQVRDGAMKQFHPESRWCMKPEQNRVTNPDDLIISTPQDNCGQFIGEVPITILDMLRAIEQSQRGAR
ncbi:hypothetical protein J4219_07830 [Candidatus Woesearchaeota archaeon]|nr:hypothetical protein [Candidatus Woesearchaeota archaeon]